MAHAGTRWPAGLVTGHALAQDHAAGQRLVCRRWSFPGLLLAGLWITLTAYYGHAKFGSQIKILLLLAFFSVAGAVVGGLLGRYHRTGTLEGFFSIESLTGGVLGRVLIAGGIAGGCYALLALAVLSYRRRQLERRHQELIQRAANETLARQALDARLRLLQAQVEPHFLFNTLASIRELAEERAPEAARLTADLIRFLRGGLGSLRQESTTLAAEFDMIEAYLSVMKTRMGDRLRWELDLPSNLREMPLPPAMLISLVENAIKHGLEPAPEGGFLRVSAHSDGERLHLEVIDSGLGLLAADQPLPVEGSGLGLRNLRERLTALYGEQAQFELMAVQPRGTLARIILPLPSETRPA